MNFFLPRRKSEITATSPEGAEEQRIQTAISSFKSLSSLPCSSTIFLAMTRTCSRKTLERLTGRSRRLITKKRSTFLSPKKWLLEATSIRKEKRSWFIMRSGSWTRTNSWVFLSRISSITFPQSTSFSQREL